MAKPEAILDVMEVGPSNSTMKIALELEISLKTIGKVLKNNIRLIPSTVGRTSSASELALKIKVDVHVVDSYGGTQYFLTKYFIYE